MGSPKSSDLPKFALLLYTLCSEQNTKKGGLPKYALLLKGGVLEFCWGWNVFVTGGPPNLTFIVS